MTERLFSPKRQDWYATRFDGGANSDCWLMCLPGQHPFLTHFSLMAGFVLSKTSVDLLAIDHTWPQDNIDAGNFVYVYPAKYSLEVDATLAQIEKALPKIVADFLDGTLVAEPSMMDGAAAKFAERVKFHLQAKS